MRNGPRPLDPTALLVTLLACAPTAPSVLAQSPLYAWELEEDARDGKGIEAEDGDRPLTSTTAPEFAHGVLVLDGKGPVLTAGRVPAAELPREELTLEATVAVRKPQKYGGFVMAFEDNGKTERGFFLGYRKKRFCFGLVTEDTKRVTYLDARRDFQLGRWYHVAATYDGDSMRLFVDGEQVARSDAQGGAVDYAADHELVVGSYKDSNEHYPDDASMAHAAVYDRASSARRIRARARRARVDRHEPLELTHEQVPIAANLPGLGALQPRIGRAIDRGVESLLAHQNLDGSWSQSGDRYRNGATALAAFALVESGVEAEHPAIQAALDFLAVEGPFKTYSAGCQLLLLHALEDPDLYEEWAEDVVRRLLDFESERLPGAWAYPEGAVDLSCTQFAALGLYAAESMGIRIDPEVWDRMARNAVERHQNIEKRVPYMGEGTGSDIDIAGFTYRSGAGVSQTTASMTTAGLCILHFTDRFAARRIPPRSRRVYELAARRALGWLGWHFSVRTNPGRPSPRMYYYLYGLERVGALYELERIGGRAWYHEGAHWIVGKQKKDGGWGNTSNTAFALLFLNRATAPTTGRPPAPKDVARTAKGDLRIQCAGRREASLYLHGIEERLVDEGLRIDRVRWYVDGEVRAEVEATDERRWRPQDAFAARIRFEEAGQHEVWAEADVVLGVERDGRDAEYSEDRLLESRTLKVTSLPDHRGRMRYARRVVGQNPLQRTYSTSVSASSASADASRVVDGRHGTAWVSRENAREPWVRLRFRRPVGADRVVLSPADSSFATRDRHDVPTEIVLVVNGDERPPLRVPNDPVGAIVLPLDEDGEWDTMGVRELEVRVTAREPGGARRGRVGFSEIALRVGDAPARHTR